MARDLYTIISSTYAGEKPERLTRYFETIKNQTLPPFEIILCLDGELSDELTKIISKYLELLPIRLVQNQKIGLANNLHKALLLVKTPYTARCDTDDYFEKDRFEKQLEFIKSNDVDITSCFAQEWASGKPAYIKTVPLSKLDNSSFSLYFKNPINHHSVFFKTEPVRSINYSDGRMEDFRLWVNCVKNGLTILNAPDLLVHASADGIEKRRFGKDYRAAEIALLRLNFARNLPMSAIVSVCAFAIRFPLRFKLLVAFLKMALRTSRSKSPNTKVAE